MKRYNFYLTDQEIEFIKGQAEKKELATSDYLRRLIDREMEKNASKEEKGRCQNN